jgi:TetR/AcrR family transcriptional regulator, cholesterol catabolism regulator
MSPTENRQKQLDHKKWEKASAIGKIAAALFNQRGYLETSMDDISTAGQLSKGGIYHYFSSKHEILYFISTNYMDLLLRDLEQELKKIDGGLSKIKFIIFRHIDTYTKYTSEAKTTLHEAHLLPPRYLKIYSGKERKYYRIVADVLSEVIGEPIPKSRLRVITFTLLGMCNWIYHWYKPRGHVTPSELSEIITNIFSKGIIGHRG